MVIGGYDGDWLSDAEFFGLDDAKECGKPRDLPNTLEGAVGHFDDGRNTPVLCGGSDGHEMEHSRACYEYSLADDGWSRAGFALKDPRFYAASVTLLSNGSFLVLGGQRTVFNVIASSEYPVEGAHGPDLPYTTYKHCACNVNRTHVFMAGGTDMPDKNPRPLDSAHILGLRDGQWSKLPPMSTGRKEHSCVALKGGTEILAFGGRDESGAELFRFRAWDWWKVGSLPKKIGEMASVGYGHGLLVVGGVEQGEKFLDLVLEFDLDNYNFVERSERMAKARSKHVAIPMKRGWDEEAKICIGK